MKSLSKISLFLFAIVFIFSPIFVFAQAVINVNIPGGQPASINNPCTTVINFYWFALLISGILAFGAIVWGGVKYTIAAGNPSAQSEGKDWIMGALLGLLLLAGSYLVLNTINPALTKCEIQGLSRLPEANFSLSDFLSGFQGLGGTSTGSFDPSSLGWDTGGGGLPNIATAAIALEGMSTADGPDGGNQACAWAVNKVLTAAGVAPLDTDSVPALENALTSGRGTLIDSSSARAGDIVVEGGDQWHVGICMNNGCTRVISNSSSRASFRWISDTNFDSYYGGTPSRIYRVNN